MNKHLTFLAAQIALCLLLASCATELTDDSVTLTPSLPHSHTPTLPEPFPTPRPSPLAPRPSPSPTNPPAAGSTFVEHTVQPGDTLLDMATTYDVPMAAIQLQNEMGDSTVVQVGQVLSIPPRAGWEGASRFWVVHVVKAGETLVGIARTYGLKAADLKAVNGLSDADLIVVGQELILPLDASAVAITPTPAHTPTSPPTATPALSSTVEPPAAPPPADIAAWPHETVCIINEVRAAHGLGPLAYNETLAQAAQGQANDCAQRGWCSHTGSDGSNIKTRILRAGYATPPVGLNVGHSARRPRARWISGWTRCRLTTPTGARCSPPIFRKSAWAWPRPVGATILSLTLADRAKYAQSTPGEGRTQWPCCSRKQQGHICVTDLTNCANRCDRLYAQASPCVR